MIKDEHYGVPSFVVYVVKTPVMVIVGRCPVDCEVFLDYSCVIYVRQVKVTNFVSVSQNDIHAIIVL